MGTRRGDTKEFLQLMYSLHSYYTHLLVNVIIFRIWLYSIRYGAELNTDGWKGHASEMRNSQRNDASIKSIANDIRIRKGLNCFQRLYSS